MSNRKKVSAANLKKVLAENVRRDQLARFARARAAEERTPPEEMVATNEERYGRPSQIKEVRFEPHPHDDH